MAGDVACRILIGPKDPDGVDSGASSGLTLLMSPAWLKVLMQVVSLLRL